MRYAETAGLLGWKSRAVLCGGGVRDPSTQSMNETQI